MVTVWNNAPLILVGVAVGYLFNPSSSPSIVDKHSTPRNSSSPSSSLPESKPRLPPPRIELGPLQDAVHAFAGWRLETLRTLSQKRANFQNLPLRHAALAEKINYTQKFADVEKSIDRTAEFTSLVAQGARKRYPGLKLDFDIRDGRIPIDDQSVSLRSFCLVCTVAVYDVNLIGMCHAGPDRAATYRPRLELRWSI